MRVDDSGRRLGIAALVLVVTSGSDAGRLLGTAQFATTPAGHRQLLSWLKRHGTVILIGVEGTGAYGAGLTRYLHTQHVRVVEVDRPDRSLRRHEGKSDLGFTFQARRARSRKGKNFTNFLPAISKEDLKKISGEVRSWRLHLRIGLTFAAGLRRSRVMSGS
ncbi:hypothetical protein AQJ46_49780 [Streptomyces canus]|uniref:Transposase IS110-like N-terminal domain-containing protein n=1 Tax=Streptomyces canus TaxID=58343 RepID=A0A124HV19_9ACTN|nr:MULTISPECIES: IS110 family transposase [Streptomyces]KUN54936.1 hypothetical protein AQJ46_49780 [Streptomyces canus]MDI5906463.1 IS110 family transposase [Streptomyces sp. 12257]